MKNKTIGKTITLANIAVYGRFNNMTLFDITSWDHAYLGDLMIQAAIKQKIGSIVLEGCVRDLESLDAMGMPIL